ncbi:hypothetical protein JW721_03235 [Candidatus Micrarchaeota archaeon]|nr:hypothetical protein [Candidatus Micrarchaeota archaeon]
MHEGKIAEFGLYLVEFSAWEVSPKDTSALGIALESTCTKSLRETVEAMDISTEGRLWKKRVRSAEAMEALSKLAGSLARSSGEEARENVRRAANSMRMVRSPAKLLLFAKAMEAAIVHSENKEAWRGALNAFTGVLRRDSKKAGYIATYVLKNICGNPKAGRAKKELAERVLVRAAFVPDANLSRVAIPAMGSIKGPLGLATLIALSSNGGLPPDASASASSMIHEIGAGLEGSKSGGRAAMKLAFAGEMLEEGSVAQMEVFAGFRSLLGGIVELPDPFFLPDAGASGYPVPTLEKGGAHDASFAALSRIKSWWAVSALLGGIAQLIAPHLELPPRQVIGERPIIRALPRVAERLCAVLALNGVSGAETFSSLIAGPDFGEISKVCPLEARDMGPCACALLEEASAANLTGFAIPVRAAGLIKRGMEARLKEGASGEYAARVMAANLLLIVGRYERIANRGGFAIDREKMIEFLSKVAKEQLQKRGEIRSLQSPRRIK